jgi:hypothetical protein
MPARELFAVCNGSILVGLCRQSFARHDLPSFLRQASVVAGAKILTGAARCANTLFDVAGYNPPFLSVISAARQKNVTALIALGKTRNTESGVALGHCTNLFCDGTHCPLLCRDTSSLPISFASGRYLALQHWV